MKVGIIIAISLAIRLVAINQSLWLDEAVTANVVKNNSYQEIVTKFSVNDFHPPLFYLVTKAWTEVFGYSEVSLRMPSVIFSLATIYVIYLIGGAGPAILVGFNPLLLYYSQEARMYSMATMFLMLWWWAIKNNKTKLTNLFSFLAVMTYYGSVLPILAMNIYWLTARQFKKIGQNNFGLVGAGLILAPLFLRQWQNSKIMLSQVANWNLVLGKVELKNLLLMPIKFFSGRISFYPKIVYYLIAGAWTVIVGLKIIKKKQEMAVVGITLALGLILSFWAPMLQYFRFLYLIPLLCLVIGKSRVVTAGFLVFSLVYVLFPQFHREDWKTLASDMKTNKVYMIGSFGDPMMYYRPDIEILDVRSWILDRTVEVVPYGEEIHGVDHKKILGDLGYAMIREKSFRGVTSEKWEKKEKAGR
ncbi:MAG: glycosyltransferase family 39 protein [Candidatus Shapirobacteria bacterium]|jgi:uncharacterized membrane protein